MDTMKLYTDDDIAKIWECIYDHGNGKYKGDASKAQRDEALAILDNGQRVEVVAKSNKDRDANISVHWVRRVNEGWVDLYAVKDETK
jgi:hypothetical protein